MPKPKRYTEEEMKERIRESKRRYDARNREELNQKALEKYHKKKGRENYLTRNEMMKKLKELEETVEREKKQ